MKKAIAFLMALALVGGVVFAQDAAPVAKGLVDILTTAPTVTYGIDAGLDHNALVSRAQDQIDAADGLLSFENPLGMNETYFFTTPWMKIAFGDMSFTGKYYWDPNGYDNLPYAGTLNGDFTDIVGADKILEGAFAYKYDNLSVGSTFYMDPDAPGLFYNRSNITASAGNASATFATMSEIDNDFTYFGIGNTVITDASFTMKDLFDVWTMKVGGSGSNMLRIGSIQTGAPFYSVMGSATTNGRIRIRDTAGALGALATVIGVNGTELPVINTLNLGKFDLPLTVYVGSAVPYAATDLRDYLAGQKLTLAAKYALADVGSFDFGYMAGLGYDKGIAEAAGVYTTSKVVNNNTIFADAKLEGLVSGLTALVAFDLNLGQAVDFDAVAPAGKDGTTAANATPVTYIGSTKFNFGVEFNYDMADMVEGLSLDGGVYLLGGAGKTYENQTVGTDTFAAYLDATYPTATWFRMANYTADSYNQQAYYAGNPLKGFVKASYALNDTLSLSFRDTYIAKAGALNSASTTYASAVKKPVGFYDSNEIKLGATIVQGNATIDLGFAFTSLLGLPTATDMGYVDSTVLGTIKTAKDQAYDEAPATVRAPWSLNAVYTISF